MEESGLNKKYVYTYVHGDTNNSIHSVTKLSGCNTAPPYG